MLDENLVLNLVELKMIAERCKCILRITKIWLNFAQEFLNHSHICPLDGTHFTRIYLLSQISIRSIHSSLSVNHCAKKKIDCTNVIPSFVMSVAVDVPNVSICKLCAYKTTTKTRREFNNKNSIILYRIK